jgi:hypothetical protein
MGVLSECLGWQYEGDEHQAKHQGHQEPFGVKEAGSHGGGWVEGFGCWKEGV